MCVCVWLSQPDGAVCYSPWNTSEIRQWFSLEKSDKKFRKSGKISLVDIYIISNCLKMRKKKSQTLSANSQSLINCFNFKEEKNTCLFIDSWAIGGTIILLAGLWDLSKQGFLKMKQEMPILGCTMTWPLTGKEVLNPEKPKSWCVYSSAFFSWVNGHSQLRILCKRHSWLACGLTNSDAC